MVEDSVLRCLIAVRYEGRVMDQVFDAVRQGDNVLIVLEWGSPDENQRGLSPKQYVAIPLSEIEVDADPSKEYEIVSRTGIDLDVASFTDVRVSPEKLFQPPPRE